MNFSTRYFLFLQVAVAAFITFFSSAYGTERVPIPVPKNVVYAGQIIDARLLRDRSVPANYLSRVSVFTSASDVVGKIARTTLMPNRPIPTNYIIEPNVVEVNRKTIMRFQSGRLKITAEVIPLNAAKTGDMVRARNISSGVVVYGVANADGSISTAGVQ
ncbi:MAG: flagellar basal body P-ring formation chaperone FlgA [Pseudomonadota bacterium]